MIRDVEVDCVDAVTPTPMGDLTPVQCREEAGPDVILSGGVSPDLWLPDIGTEAFKEAVVEWLNLRKSGPRLIANAGDQVPPGAVEERIAMMRELVEEYGRY
jgi:uroporphyrinogen-III decarboxylase